MLEQTVLQLPDLLDTMDSVDSAHKPFVSTSLRRYALFFKHGVPINPMGNDVALSLFKNWRIWHSFNDCWGSVTFWCGSADLRLGISD